MILINVVVLSSILKLTFLIRLLISKCSEVCRWWVVESDTEEDIQLQRIILSEC